MIKSVKIGKYYGNNGEMIEKLYGNGCKWYRKVSNLVG
jgi:hypothetical protein